MAPTPESLVTVSSGWNHLMNVFANRAARNLGNSQQARRGIRQLINRRR